METKVKGGSCNGIGRIFSLTLSEVVRSRNRLPSVVDKSSGLSVHTSPAKDEGMAPKERSEKVTGKHVFDSQAKFGDTFTEQTDHYGNRAMTAGSSGFGSEKKINVNSSMPPYSTPKTNSGLFPSQNVNVPSTSTAEESTVCDNSPSQDATCRTKNLSAEVMVDLGCFSPKRQGVNVSQSSTASLVKKTCEKQGGTENQLSSMTSDSSFAKRTRENSKTVEIVKVSPITASQESSRNDQRPLATRLSYVKKTSKPSAESKQGYVMKNSMRESVSKAPSDSPNSKSKNVSSPKPNHATQTSTNKRKDFAVADLQRYTSLTNVPHNKKDSRFVAADGVRDLKHPYFFSEQDKCRSHENPKKVSNWTATDCQRRDSNVQRPTKPHWSQGNRRGASAKSLTSSFVNSTQRIDSTEECHGPASVSVRHRTTQNGLELEVNKDILNVSNRNCHMSGSFSKVGNQMSVLSQLSKDTVEKSLNKDWSKDCIETTALNHQPKSELKSKVKSEGGQSGEIVREVQHEKETTFSTDHSISREVKQVQANDTEKKLKTTVGAEFSRTLLSVCIGSNIKVGAESEVDEVFTPGPECKAAPSQILVDIQPQHEDGNSQNLSSIQSLCLAKKRQASVSTRMRGNNRIKCSFAKRNLEESSIGVYLADNFVVNKKVEKDFPTCILGSTQGKISTEMDSSSFRKDTPEIESKNKERCPKSTQGKINTEMDSSSFTKDTTETESKNKERYPPKQEVVSDLEEKDSHPNGKTKLKSSLKEKTTDNAKQNCRPSPREQISASSVKKFEVSEKDKFKPPESVRIGQIQDKQIHSVSCKSQMKKNSSALVQQPSPLLSLQPKPTPDFMEFLQLSEQLTHGKRLPLLGIRPRSLSLPECFDYSSSSKESVAGSPVPLCRCSLKFKLHNQGQHCTCIPSKSSDLSADTEPRTVEACGVTTQRKSTNADSGGKNVVTQRKSTNANTVGKDVETGPSLRITSDSSPSTGSGKDRNEMDPFPFQAFDLRSQRRKEVSDMNSRESDTDVETYCYAQLENSDVETRCKDGVEEYPSSLDWNGIPEGASTDSGDFCSNPQVESNNKQAYISHLETNDRNKKKKNMFGRRQGFFPGSHQLTSLVAGSHQLTRSEKTQLQSEQVPTGGKHDYTSDSTDKHCCRSGNECQPKSEAFDRSCWKRYHNLQSKDKRIGEQVRRVSSNRRFQHDIPTKFGGIQHATGSNHLRRQASRKYGSSHAHCERSQQQIGLTHSQTSTGKICQSPEISVKANHFCFKPVPYRTHAYHSQAVSDDAGTDSCAESLHSQISGENLEEPDHLHSDVSSTGRRKESSHTGFLQSLGEPHKTQDTYDQVHEQATSQHLHTTPEKPACSLTSDTKLHQACCPLHPGLDAACKDHCHSESVSNYVGRQPVCSQRSSCCLQSESNPFPLQVVKGVPGRDRCDSLSLSDLGCLNAQTSSSSDCGVDFLSQSDNEDLPSLAKLAQKTQSDPFHAHASDEFWRKCDIDAFLRESCYPAYSAESSDHLCYPSHPMDPGDGWDPYYEQWYNAWMAYSMAYYGYAFQDSEQNMACSEEHGIHDSSRSSAYYHHQQQHSASRFPCRPPSRLPSHTHSCMEESGRDEKSCSPSDTESNLHQDAGANGDTKVIRSDECCGAIRIPSNSLKTINSAQNLLEYVHKQTAQAAGKPDVSFELIVRMENQGGGSAASDRPMENEAYTRADSRDLIKIGAVKSLNASASRVSTSEEQKHMVVPPGRDMQHFWRFRPRTCTPGSFSSGLGRPGCQGDYQRQFPDTMVPASVDPYRFCLPPVYPGPRLRYPTPTPNNGSEDGREVEHAQSCSGQNSSSGEQPYTERRVFSTHSEPSIHFHDRSPFYHLPPPPPLLPPPPPPPPPSVHQHSFATGRCPSGSFETNSCQETSSSEVFPLDSSFDMQGDYDASSSDLDEEERKPASSTEKSRKTGSLFSPFSEAQKDYNHQEYKDSGSEDFDSSSSLWQSPSALPSASQKARISHTLPDISTCRKSTSLAHFLHQRPIPGAGRGQIRRSYPPAVQSTAGASLGSSMSSATRKPVWQKDKTKVSPVSSHTQVLTSYPEKWSKLGDEVQQYDQDFPELGCSPSSASNFALGTYSNNRSATQQLSSKVKEDDTCKTFFRKKPFYVADVSSFSGRSSYSSSGQKTSYSSRLREKWASDSRRPEAREAFSKPYKTLFVDTHCHLDFLFNREPYLGSFASYREKNKETFPSNFEGCVAVFCNPKSFTNEFAWLMCYLLQQKMTKKKKMQWPARWKPIVEEPRVWMAMGCHPKSAKSYTEWAEMGLRQALKHKKTVALGEIGLDYSRHYGEMAALQKEVFIRQIKIALEMKLPLVIHCREAENDCLQILEEHVPLDYKIHCHCFTSNYKSALRWISRFKNLFIGLTPLVTYKTAVDTHEVARNIPLDRLLFETDAPYFLPCGFDGEGLSMSHPGMALMVAIKVAELRGITVEEVLCQVRSNTHSMYNI